MAVMKRMLVSDSAVYLVSRTAMARPVPPPSINALCNVKSFAVFDLNVNKTLLGDTGIELSE